MKTLSCLSLRRPLCRLVSTFAVLAIVGGFYLTARAQIGTGWSPGGETLPSQQTSGGCTITPIPGGYEFHVPAGHGRAELRWSGADLTTTWLWEGTAKIVDFPAGASSICIYQLWGSPSGDVIIDMDTGGSVGTSTNLISLHDARKVVGNVQIGMPFLFDAGYDAKTAIEYIYINGSQTGATILIDPAPGHYDKNGLYVSNSGNGPATLDWTNMSNWKGGILPPIIILPEPPTNLLSTGKTDSTVTLSWTASLTFTVTGYNLYNGSAKVGTSTSTSFTVTGLTANTAYTFTARATDGTKESNDSNSVSVTTNPPPILLPPTHLTLTGHTDTSLTITWPPSTSPGVTGYKIYGDGVLIGTTASTSYTVAGLTPNTAYTFTIRATAGTMESVDSTPLIATTDPLPILLPPTNVTSTGKTDTTVGLSWTASTSSGVTGYNIYSSGTKVGTSTSTSFTVTGLTASTIYTFTVRATDGTNESADSNSVVVTTTGGGIPIQFIVPGSAVTASTFQSPNAPANTVDGDLNTRWSADTNGQWIQYDLGSTQTVTSVKVAVYLGTSRVQTFDIETSSDGTTFTPVATGLKSSGTTLALETYTLPAPVSTRFVRLLCHGNTVNTWNSLTEVQIWGSTVCASPVITSSPTWTITAGVPSSYQITATHSPTSYAATGLPAGLSLDPFTGLISGTPTAPGTYVITLIITNDCGTGTKTLILTVNPKTPILWYLDGAADFPPNGSDLIWQNTVSGQCVIWLMNGTTEVSNVNLGIFSTDWHIVGAADFLQNGNADLIWQNTANGQCAIWLMNGTTYVRSVDLGSLPLAWRLVGAGKFSGPNQPNQPDLIWQNTVTGQRAIWLMNGTTYASSVSLGNVTTDWNLVGAADFSNNGNSDLIWQNTANGECALWLMNGTTYVTGVDLGSLPIAWRLVGAGYFSGPNQPDLILQNMVTGQWAIWKMKGILPLPGPLLIFPIDLPQVAEPTFNPPGGFNPSSVTISDATSDVSIRYTTDGSTPSETNGTLYSSPLNLRPAGSMTTLKAIAYANGYVDSPVASATYEFVVIDPSPLLFNPLGGTYSSLQHVTITSMRSGETIRYTTDGSVPSETHGTLYSGPVNISGTTTLEAVGYISGFPEDSAGSATYTFPPAPPTGLAISAISSSAISVTWNASTAATSYDLQVDGTTIPGVTSPYASTGLAVGSTHTYAVRADNSAGDSAFSAPVSATNPATGGSF